MRGGRRPKDRPEAGFTLIETLIATALFLIVVAALATITGQWLPSWDHGIARVQRAEQLAFGIDRIAADLAAAQFVSPNAKMKNPIFDGTELGVTFVRGAVGPNTRPGLEIVRLAEIGSERGPVLARASAPFVPLPDPNVISSLKFSEPVVLVRSPFRVLFAYAGPDGGWQATWRGADKLPRAVRVTVRDAVSGETLAVSSAITIHVEVAPECIKANAQNCAGAAPAAAAAATTPATQNPGGRNE
ncbi:MAG TPA: prepilin-type N-terminal cleavage/methylation domain-containing protein [Xanthobacteraceae bacterium]|nr:prepilin-type N-terminal cleavage/methylation domain-containing protein [Xanthobacteraceae bacterium]